MKIGIIACESFERGLEVITLDDPDIVFKEYLEFGLHKYPEELKRTVIAKVNSLEGEVDAVLLGYGICSSLRDVTEQLKVPTVRLDADDCIGVILTSPEYERERKKCAGTLYHTPYFAQRGLENLKKEMIERIPNYEELGIGVDWYLEKLFDGYSRVLYIDDGLGDADKLMVRSKQVADELKLRHERRCGSLAVLMEGLERTKELARGGTARPATASSSIEAGPPGGCF
jgi:Protein of unknown function (DUF1638)